MERGSSSAQAAAFVVCCSVSVEVRGWTQPFTGHSFHFFPSNVFHFCSFHVVFMYSGFGFFSFDFDIKSASSFILKGLCLCGFLMFQWNFSLLQFASILISLFSTCAFFCLTCVQPSPSMFIRWDDCVSVFSLFLHFYCRFFCETFISTNYRLWMKNCVFNALIV